MSYTRAATFNGKSDIPQHRFNQGFTLLTNYTWSHCISSYDFTTDLNGTGFLNPNNLAMDRGNCNFDIRNIFNASIVGTSSRKGNSLLSKVLKDWQLAPLLRAQSGAPVNITTGKDNSLAGTNTVTNADRPNLISPNIYTSSWGSSLQYINPAAFAQNSPGTFGSLGRNVARTPGLLSLDASLDRIFDVTEHLHLDVRADAFNVINHTNFSAASQTGIQIPGISTGVSAVLNATSFGRLTAAGDPRIFQFAMKLIF